MSLNIRWICLLLGLLISACNEDQENQKTTNPFDRFENPSISSLDLGRPSELQTANLEKSTEPAFSQDIQSERSHETLNSIQRCGKIRVTCVVDGDTLWVDGVKIRIADIDTPEIGQPKCSYEKAHGEKATDRLIELLNAGPVTIATTSGPDEDRYGRKLRVIRQNGRSLGQQLVNEGLAHEWGGKRLSWC